MIVSVRNFIEDFFSIKFTDPETQKTEVLTPDQFSKSIWGALEEVYETHVELGKEKIFALINNVNKLLAEFEPKESLKGFETSRLYPVSDSEQDGGVTRSWYDTILFLGILRKRDNVP